MDNNFSPQHSDSPFHYMLRASGQGEVWHDFTEWAKFGQYGWRCLTNEDAYSTATLIGNWSEKRFDSRRCMAKRRPLQSQFSHYYQTTYSLTYNKDDRCPKYHPLKRQPRIFPGHQPEFDPPHIRCVPGSCYRLDYQVPKQSGGTERASSATHPGQESSVSPTGGRDPVSGQPASPTLYQ